MKSICRTKLNNIREREVAMVVGVLIVSRKDKLKEREWFIELPSRKKYQEKAQVDFVKSYTSHLKKMEQC